MSLRLGERLDTQEVPSRRRALVEELRAIERDWTRVRARLASLGPGERLPGLHLVVGVAGGRVLVPCARIAEIARVVACDPVPGAAPSIVGSFVWRGRPALALDVGVRMGGARADSLEAIMVILDGAPAVALVVDEVRGLVEDPLLADGATSAEPHLVLGACLVADETVPIIAPEVLEREAQELA